MRTGRSLLHDLEAVFLDHRIGQHVLGNLLQLLLRLVARPSFQIEHKKFALAYVGNRGVTESGKSVVNGLTLRIQNRALWHNPNVSFHGKSIAGDENSGGAPLGLWFNNGCACRGDFKLAANSRNIRPLIGWKTT